MRPVGKALNRNILPRNQSCVGSTGIYFPETSPVCLPVSGCQSNDNVRAPPCRWNSTCFFLGSSCCGANWLDISGRLWVPWAACSFPAAFYPAQQLTLVEHSLPASFRRTGKADNMCPLNITCRDSNSCQVIQCCNQLPRLN